MLKINVSIIEFFINFLIIVHINHVKTFINYINFYTLYYIILIIFLFSKIFDDSLTYINIKKIENFSFHCKKQKKSRLTFKIMNF